MTNEKKKKVLIRVENLKQYFPLQKASMFAEQLFVRANDDVSLDIYEGETFGLVGESGCGKSTLGRTLLQVYTQTDGRTIYYGRDLYEIAPKYVPNTLKNLTNIKKQYIEAEEKEQGLKISYEAMPDVDEAKKSKEETLRKAYDAMPEGDDKSKALEELKVAEKATKDVLDNKYKALGKLRAAQKVTKDLLNDMSQIVGGLVLADDMEPVSKIFTKEYEVALKARKLHDKIVVQEIKLETKKSLLADKGKKENEIKKETEKLVKEIQTNEADLVKLNQELKAIEDNIDQMMKPYKQHADFDKYEKFRDKGIDLAKLTISEMKIIRKDLQLIFQDPYSSLNPRMTVGQIVSEGLYEHKMFSKADKKGQQYILDTMEKCGLQKYFVHRYPHQFSGGQRQRIGIARSVALRPKFIVCDEAVSALDVSIQSQIINLLQDLKEQENLTYLFISHDLSVVKYISDRIGVMYLGNIAELATTAELFSRPLHPYTEALLNAIPTTDVDDNKKDAYVLEGDIPSPIKPPPGCKFHTRCRYATDICKKVPPLFEEAAPGHFVACHHKLNQ